MVGIYKIQEDLGVTDKEILRSIETHTVGSSDMSLLDKIVLCGRLYRAKSPFSLGGRSARDC